MHPSIKRALNDWLQGRPKGRVAYLGSYDLNGSIDVDFVGFDIVKGPGVDVVIKVGQIPEEHKGQYDVVVSISSFQFCPFPEQYLQEAYDLLREGGELFLSMCGWTCRSTHTTSNEVFDDSVRYSMTGLARLIDSKMSVTGMEKVVSGKGEVADLVVTAVKGKIR